jgi:hypothetical protein
MCEHRHERRRKATARSIASGPRIGTIEKEEQPSTSRSTLVFHRSLAMDGGLVRTTMSGKDDNRPIPVSERLPPPLKRVFVICAKFRCRGYVDDDNVWRYDSDGKAIEDVIAWTE